jgi:hypothetical protein
MLSNCHGPEVLPAGDGVSWKRKGGNGKRERELMEVSCPAQMKYYCRTFHLINKGNGTKAPYNMGGKSRTHNWLPKIILQLINMMMVNAYRLYKALVTMQMPDWQCLMIKDAIKELTFLLMQQGAPMQTREESHPNLKVNYLQILGWTSGNKVRSDATHQVVVEPIICQEMWLDWAVLARMQKKRHGGII